jgi:hypothetical protein
MLENILYRTSDDIGENGEDNIFGFGRINVASAVKYVADLYRVPEIVSSTTKEPRIRNRSNGVVLDLE